MQGSILAQLAAALSNLDEAFALLNRAYVERDLRLIFIGAWPDYDPLREDSRSMICCDGLAYRESRCDFPPERSVAL